MYCWSISNVEQESLTIVNLVAAGLSIIGSFLTIVSFLISRDKKQKMNQLVFFLALTDLGTSAGIVVGQVVALKYTGGQPMQFCVLIRALLQFFIVSSFFWTTCIAIHMYRAINHLPQYKALYASFHIFSWGVPLVLTVIELLGDMIVRAEGAPWCNLKTQPEWIFWFGPMISSLVINFILFIMVLRSFRKRELTSIQRRVESQATRKLSLYLLAFILCWVWNVIGRIIHEFQGNCAIYPLWLLQDFFSPLQGFLNFIVYGLTAGRMMDCFKRKRLISYHEYSRRDEGQPLNTPTRSSINDDG